MTIKNYSVSLEEEIVEEAKKLMYPKGQKLSPIINQFIIKWIKEQKEAEKK